MTPTTTTIDLPRVAAQWRAHLAECVRQGNTVAVEWARAHVDWFTRKAGEERADG